MRVTNRNLTTSTVFHFCHAGLDEIKKPLGLDSICSSNGQDVAVDVHLLAQVGRTKLVVFEQT